MASRDFGTSPGDTPERCRPTGSAPSRRNVTGPSRRSVSRRRLRPLSRACLLARFRGVRRFNPLPGACSDPGPVAHVATSSRSD